MGLVSAKDMLVKARKEGYAVGQFNINNLEWTRAILQASEKAQSPVILGVSEGAAKYMTGYKTVVAMVEGMLDFYNITVLVHRLGSQHILKQHGLIRTREPRIPTHPRHHQTPVAHLQALRLHQFMTLPALGKINPMPPLQLFNWNSTDPGHFLHCRRYLLGKRQTGTRPKHKPGSHQLR